MVDLSKWCRHLGSPDREKFNDLIISAKYQVPPTRRLVLTPVLTPVSLATPIRFTFIKFPEKIYPADDDNKGVTRKEERVYTTTTTEWRWRNQYGVQPHSPQLASPVWRIVSTSFIRRRGEQTA